MKDDLAPITQFSTSHDGVFIPCEGNFMYGNASLSYYDKNTKTVENQVFFRANGIPIGDVLQSVTISDSLAYLVVNNSGKIYVVNKNTFIYVSKITELVSPRYIRFITPSKAYVSDMYSRSIYVVNPHTCMVDKTINIDDGSGEYFRHSSEQMIVYDSLVFVNSWSYDNKILVINANTDELVSQIEVLKQPHRMVMDKNGKIWVLCDGGYQGSEYCGTPGLVKIDAATQTVERIFEFQSGDYPSEITMNGTGDTIYYSNNHIYRFQVDSDNVTSEIFFANPQGRYYYGLGVDPVNSEVYVADAVDYMQSGVVYRLNAAGEEIDSFKVGIIPNGFCFK
ncbi:MAG: DUF5074 domain-containing protein [Bacteroidales bacterium]|nr:DUF5074 domain-containing protein [Bacteroidales bacterium]